MTIKAEILPLSDTNCVQIAAETLRKGGVIIYPTETLYGIGALADNVEAINKIFNIKKRAANKPLLTLVKDTDMIRKYFKISEKQIYLYKKFSKLPLTIIVEQKFRFPDELSAGTKKVGIRISSNQFVAELFKFIHIPLASTSANISGQEQITKIEDIIDQFSYKVDVIVNSGNLPHSKGSTILDITTHPVVMVREGDIEKKELKEFFIGNDQGI